jgi:hypothetical protein
LTKGEALTTIGAERVAIPGWTNEARTLAEDMKAWRTCVGDGGDRVVLLPYRDPFVHMRRTPAVLCAAANASVLNWDLKRVRVEDVDTLDHHTISSGGQVVGVWEYDPKAKTVVTRVWDSDARLRRRVADAAADTTTFIREQPG